MKTRILVGVGIIVLLLLVGCDPSFDSYNRGKSFDFSNPGVIVTGKDIRLLVGDQAWSTEMKDTPLYTVDIRYTISGGSETNETLVGVPEEVYNSLVIYQVEGDIGDNYLTLEELREKRGKVLDKIADPNNEKWWIVVEEDNGAKFYNVGWKAFYYDLDRGMTLPLKP